MNNDYKIAILGDQKEVTIREGKALELQEPQKVVLEGDINTVAAFVDKRYLKYDTLTEEQRKNLENEQGQKLPENIQYNLQMFYKETAIVCFDKEKLTISLQTNPQDYYGAEVTGKLCFTEELKQWFINENHTFNREQLVKLVRFNKRYFSDPLVHDELLRAFQNLQISGKTDLTASSDTRGNRTASFQKELDTKKVPTKFYLTMPIFKGQPAEKFMVEVCLDSAEHSVLFWFESVELNELIDKRVDEIFDAQKSKFSDFVIVNK